MSSRNAPPHLRDDTKNGCVADYRYAGSNPARLRVMAERKGQVFVDERAIIVQLRWVWGASEQEAGEHFTCKLAPVERIRRLFSNL